MTDEMRGTVTRGGIEAIPFEAGLADMVDCRIQGQQTNSVEFSDDGQWQRLPEWVSFLLRFGYDWLGSDRGARRISVVSTPCDSAASGIIGFGAMRRRFTIAGANDSVAHYQRIVRLAASRDHNTFIRHRDYKGRFSVESTDANGFIWVRGEGTETRRLATRTKLTRTIIRPDTALDWYFDGEAPIRANRGSELPFRIIYENLIEAPPAVGETFTHSDSLICIAGRVTGESVSKSIYEETKFRCNKEVANLAELLTVQDWSPKRISRINFFNTRTGIFDRNNGLTGLVIADGDTAFLRAVDGRDFASSDVIGVVHRAIARENLEAIGIKLSSLTQWYALEHTTGVLPPVGIAISTLRRNL
jgi:hypothetical protein